MCTLDSKKRNFVLIALAAAIGSYVVWNAMFLAICWRAERELGTIPFRDDGWLLYQLPSYMAQSDANAIFITGSSGTRENLLVHKFQAAYPQSKIIVGACSAATLEDNILGLEYIERVYGAEHVPGTIIVGIESRTVGGFNNGFSPLQWSFDTYSPSFRVDRAHEEARLAEKNLWSSIAGRWRMMLKQPARYKTSFVAMTANAFFGPGDTNELFVNLDKMMVVWSAIQMRSSHLSKLHEVIDELGVSKSLHLWAQLYVLQYKYHHRRPVRSKTLEEWTTYPESYWYKARNWDATKDEGRVKRQFDRLIEFAKRHGCRLFVVNMPDHPISLEKYKADYYQKYLDVVDASIGDTPYLDMHNDMAAKDFYDLIHLNAAGADKMSDRVIAFISGDQGP